MPRNDKVAEFLALEFELVKLIKHIWRKIFVYLTTMQNVKKKLTPNNNSKNEITIKQKLLEHSK